MARRGPTLELPAGEIADAYRAGATIHGLAARYGVDITTIRRRLNAASVELRTRQRRWVPGPDALVVLLDAADVDRLLRGRRLVHSDGFPQPVAVCGESLLWERTAVEAWARQVDTLARIETELDEGRTAAQVARSLEMTPAQVRYRMRRYGLMGRTGRGLALTYDEAVSVLRRAAASVEPMTWENYMDWARHNGVPGPKAVVAALGASGWPDATARAGVVRHTREHQQRWTSEELVAILDRSGAVTADEYEAWRRCQDERMPSYRTFVQRFGSWTAARGVPPRYRSSRKRDKPAAKS